MLTPKTNTTRKSSAQRAAGNMQTSISISEKAKSLGDRMAGVENRNFSNFVETLLFEEAKRRGIPGFEGALPAAKK